LIYRQLEKILSDESPPAKGEEMLAALTAGERMAWAVARQEFFFKGVNRHSLDAIEKAAFIVALDDFPYEFDEVRAYLTYIIVRDHMKVSKMYW
jgi:carnitine O-palmitoyltransferase 1